MFPASSRCPRLIIRRGTCHLSSAASVNRVLSLSLSVNDRASSQVRAVAALKVEQLRGWLVLQAPTDGSQKAHFAYAASRIKRFQEDPKPASLPKLSEPPSGMPIGAGGDYCSFSE